MSMTPEQKEKLHSKLRELGSLTCPICMGIAWEITGTIFELREFQDGALAISGRVYPVVPVSCLQCGNTIFFNAIRLGIIDASQPSEPGASINEPTKHDLT